MIAYSIIQVICGLCSLITLGKAVGETKLVDRIIWLIFCIAFLVFMVLIQGVLK